MKHLFINSKDFAVAWITTTNGWEGFIKRCIEVINND